MHIEYKLQIRDGCTLFSSRNPIEIYQIAGRHIKKHPTDTLLVYATIQDLSARIWKCESTGEIRTDFSSAIFAEEAKQ